MERQEKTPPTRIESFNRTIEAYQKHVIEKELVDKFALVIRGEKLDILNVLAGDIDKKDPELLNWCQRLRTSLRIICVPVGKVVNMNDSEYKEFLMEPTKKNGEPQMTRFVEFKCLCDLKPYSSLFETRVLKSPYATRTISRGES